METEEPRRVFPRDEGLERERIESRKHDDRVDEEADEPRRAPPADALAEEADEARRGP